jgi:hypothetical protein
LVIDFRAQLKSGCAFLQNMTKKTRVGVLALQGDFDAHRRRMEQLGAEVVRHGGQCRVELRFRLVLVTQPEVAEAGNVVCVCRAGPLGFAVDEVGVVRIDGLRRRRCKRGAG